MLKYLAKISMDIFPSVLATIIGAYIVNHYINAKPAPDAPAAAAVAPAQPKKGAKPAGATDVANLPAPGIKAKGISEKAVSDKPAEVKPTEAKTPEAKPAEAKAPEAKTPETKSTEEAAAPANPRAHQPAFREKAIAKVTPAPAAPSVEASAAPAGNAATPDANDLARAAIERLRKPEAPVQESARAAEAPRAQDAPRIATATPAAVRPLPPPITVSSPASEVFSTQQQPSSPAYTASVGGEDANRPTPPADIPVPIVSAPPPLDLRADAAGPMPRAKNNVANVADDMLSAAKSMFHAVIPKAVTPD